jgi:hypothetical protein
MRKMHGRTKRHHRLRTHLCGAKVFKERKMKKIKKNLAKITAKQKLKNNQQKDDS